MQLAFYGTFCRKLLYFSVTLLYESKFKFMTRCFPLVLRSCTFYAIDIFFFLYLWLFFQPRLRIFATESNAGMALFVIVTAQDVLVKVGLDKRFRG